jgi:HEAT repeat protein
MAPDHVPNGDGDDPRDRGARPGRETHAGGRDPLADVRLADFVAFLAGDDPGGIGPRLVEAMDDPDGLVARLVAGAAPPLRVPGDAEAEADGDGDGPRTDAELLAELRASEAALPWVPRVDARPRVRTPWRLRPAPKIAASLLVGLTLVAAATCASWMEQDRRSRMALVVGISEYKDEISDVRQQLAAALATSRELKDQVRALNIDLQREKGRGLPVLTLLETQTERSSLFAGLRRDGGDPSGDLPITGRGPPRADGFAASRPRYWAAGPEPSREALVALLDALGDEEPRARSSAIGVLCRLTPDRDEVVGRIAQIAGDDAVDAVRAKALTGLSWMETGSRLVDHPSLRRLITRALRDPSPLVRAKACELVISDDLKSQEVVDGLIRIMNGDDPVRVRTRAAGLLAHSLLEDAVGGLVEALGNSPSEAVREAAAGALGDLDGERVPLHPLVQGLGDPAEGVRNAVSRAMATLSRSPKKEAVVDELIGVLAGDGRDEARAAAVSALGEIGQDRVPAAPLLRALGDPAEPVQLAAASALGKFREKDGVVAGLVGVLRDNNRSEAVHEAAAAALVSVGNGSTSLGPLVQALNDPAESVRKRAASALGGLTDSRGTLKEIPVLIGLARSSDDKSVRLSAIKLLGQLGRKAESGLKQLEAIRADKDAEVRKAASSSAERILKDLYDAYGKANEWDKAAAAAEKMTGIDPQNYLAFHLLGRAEQGRERWGPAEVAYSKALELNPMSPGSWGGRAKVRLERGEWEGAIGDAAMAIKRDRDKDQAWNTRARALAAMGLWDRAITDGRELIERDPSDGTLARILLRAGVLPEYRTECQRLLDRLGTPSNSDVKSIDVLCWTCGLGPDAVTDLSRIVRMAERNVAGNLTHEYIQTLGATYYRAGRWEDAVRVFREACALDRGEGDAFDNAFLAMALARLGRVGEARAALRRSVARYEKSLENRREPANAMERVLQREAEAVIIAQVFAEPFSPAGATTPQ